MKRPLLISICFSLAGGFTIGTWLAAAGGSLLAGIALSVAGFLIGQEPRT